ncbi:MAG: serine protease [Alphaproteobacteria bacterium]|nr:serine protease [Alphaproteobacteria bacterium]
MPKIANATCIALLSLASATGARAAPTIENLKNPNIGKMSAEEMTDAEPMPLPAITQEEHDEMKRRFRELNPAIPDQRPLPGDRGAIATPGILEKIAAPDVSAPYWSAGRLSFRDDTGKAKWCSAQYVDDLKVILTAAHCVINHANGIWHSDFSFARASADGGSPQTIDWRCISIFDAYHRPSVNYAYDYAFILARSDDERPPLELASGIPASTDLTAIGYPSTPDGGRYLYKVAGSWLGVAGGIATMADNPLTAGSSGGAWFADFEAGGSGGKNRVVSLNSHRLANDTQTLGPLFTNDTLALKNHVRDARCLD